MNLSGYSRMYGDGPDAGPPGKLIDRTRTYLQEAQLKDKAAYFDEENMVVYATTPFGVFVVSIDETQRYGGQLTPWQGISGCSLKITTTPASARIVTVTIERRGSERPWLTSGATMALAGRGTPLPMACPRALVVAVLRHFEHDASESRDRIEKNDDIDATFDQTFGFFKHHLGHLDVSRGRFVKR